MLLCCTSLAYQKKNQNSIFVQINPALLANRLLSNAVIEQHALSSEWPHSGEPECELMHVSWKIQDHCRSPRWPCSEIRNLCRLLRIWRKKGGNEANRATLCRTMHHVMFRRDPLCVKRPLKGFGRGVSFGVEVTVERLMRRQPHAGPTCICRVWRPPGKQCVLCRGTVSPLCCLLL